MRQSIHQSVHNNLSANPKQDKWLVSNPPITQKVTNNPFLPKQKSPIVEEERDEAERDGKAKPMQDGRIIISHRKEEIIYDNGVLLWKNTGQPYNGRAYNKKGQLRGYVRKVVEALDEIRSGRAGAELLSNIIGINNNVGDVTISRGSNGATGKNVKWRPATKQSGRNQQGKLARPSFVGLAHELAHAWDASDGTRINYNDIWFTMNGGANPIPNAEKFACHWENRIRAEHGIPLRTHYTQEANPDAALLDEQGRSLFYTQKKKTKINPTEGETGKLYYPNLREEVEIDAPYEYNK